MDELACQTKRALKDRESWSMMGMEMNGMGLLSGGVDGDAYVEESDTRSWRVSVVAPPGSMSWVARLFLIIG